MSYVSGKAWRSDWLGVQHMRRLHVCVSASVYRQERVLENELQRLATQLAPIYRRVAPVAYQNQVSRHVCCTSFRTLELNWLLIFPF